MPAAFERCRKNGGRVRTESLGKGRYRHVCYLKGEKYLGHVKVRKKEGKK